MPELPEVETMCRGIRAVIGQRIDHVAFPVGKYRPILVEPTRRAISRRVKDRIIVGIERRGKRPVLRLEDQQRLVFEPRMTGLLLVSEPPNQIHLRMEMLLRGNGAEQLLFWDRRGLGTIRLFTDKEYQAKLSPPHLGTDGLQITANELRDALSTSRRTIKTALLDQKVVAGIGNIYASEILYEARVDPRAVCSRLRPRQWERIATSTIAILLEAIEYEGSTLSDGTYRNALNQEGDYQNQHRVYDRGGLPCRRCGEKIIRIVLGQRATYFCRGCQHKTDRPK